MDKIEVEKLFELFDKALTSQDERVVNALRSLLMITALTDMGDPLDENATQRPLPIEGPLNGMLRRIRALEQQVGNIERNQQYNYDYSNPGYGAVPGAGYSGSNSGAGLNLGTLTLTGIDYSTASTYTTMNTATPDLTLDTITLTDVDLDDILKGHK